MPDTLTLSSKTLTRNAILNLIGQIAPLIVGVITIPFIVHRLGAERFGLLSLAWIILGYSTIFDLGLGRAATKYVAEAIGKNSEEQIPHLVWTSVTVQAILGLLIAVILASLSPFLGHILNIAPELMMEAEISFYLLSSIIPVILISSSFYGILEARQRFDIINLVKIPSNTSTFIIPTVSAIISPQLPGVFALILLFKAVTLSALVLINLRLFPDLKQPSPRFGILPRLIEYGGWITTANMFAPLLRYLDRLIIGALLSVSAVAYYSVAFDTIERLWVIPSSLVITLFPAFSTLAGTGHHERAQELLARSLKYLAILVGPLFLILITFARPILDIWLGADFARHSTTPFQILALGALIAIFSPILGAVIYGYGRPDIVTKLYALYLPINMGVVWLLVQHMGLNGAALSFTLRALLEAIFFLYVVARLIRLSLTSLLKDVAMNVIPVLIVILSLPLALLDDLVQQLVALCAAVILFCPIVWCYILDSKDKAVIYALLNGSCRWIAARG